MGNMPMEENAPLELSIDENDVAEEEHLGERCDYLFMTCVLCIMNRIRCSSAIKSHLDSPSAVDNSTSAAVNDLLVKME